MKSFCVLLSLLVWPMLMDAAQAPPLEKWIYCSHNLAVEKNVVELEALLRRAALAGYDHVLLADYKFGILDRVDPSYFGHVERIKKVAAELKMEIVPTVFPMGYSESLLAHNPNLAEGLPVRHALYVVHGGIARLTPEPLVALKGTDFQDFTGWPMHDPTVTLVEHSARIEEPAGRNSRIMQTVKVSPFRQYHLSVEVKAQNLTGDLPQVTLLDKQGHGLSYSNLGLRRTQDWRVCHVLFNSLDSDEVKVYLGCWGTKGGTVQWRHPMLEETGLVNLVRRPGAPFEIRLEGGGPLNEGTDYKAVADPRMGVSPYKGSFDVYHEPPSIRTSLPEGTRLRVSYYHAVTVYDGEVMACPSEPETVALLRDQARRMHAAWGAKGYFMSHDEIRVLNWDQSCAERQLDAGQILADNVKTCIGLLREVNPGGRIYVWSDMFDPTHNAKRDYYLVRGDLSHSWQGLDKDVKVMLWNFGQRAASLKWFADLGNPMLIGGYYDSDPEKIRQWLDAAGPYRGVEGVMYTTWEHKYADLEKFSAAIDRARSGK